MSIQHSIRPAGADTISSISLCICVFSFVSLGG